MILSKRWRMGMIEPVVAPQGTKATPGEMTKLLALYAAPEGEGEVEAAKVTLELIILAGRMVNGPKGPLRDEWSHPLSRGPAQDAERVRKWWRHYVGPEIGGEDKEEFEARWDEAFKKAKPDFAKNLNAAIVKHEAEAKPEEAKPTYRDLNNPEPVEAEPVAKPGLPAIISPPSPLQASGLLTTLGRVEPGNEFEEMLQRLNSQHAVINNIGKIASWMPVKRKGSSKKFEISFQSKEHFLLIYSNAKIHTRIQGKKGPLLLEVPVGPWWLEHEERQQFHGVTFEPEAPRNVGGWLNLWQGWGCEERPGDWGLIEKHNDEVVANGNKEYADYLKRWNAWSVQHPAEPPETSLVLIGEKGTGKNAWARALERIFGPHSLEVTGEEELIGRFNAHHEDCVLLIADEAYWSGNSKCVGKLQAMITQGTLWIEHKGVNRYQAPNRLHVVHLAEPGWVIPAGRHERRYAAFEVSKARLGDREYFRALFHQIDNGGAEAMFWDLRRMDLGHWHPRELPKALLHSRALQKQQMKTLPPWEKWYLKLLHDGKLPNSFDKRPNATLTRSLLRNVREAIPHLKNATDTDLKDFLETKDCEKKHFASGNGYVFLPLGVARRAWEEGYGPQDWHNHVEEWGDVGAEGG
jgi:hypothetical protein